MSKYARRTHPYNLRSNNKNTITRCGVCEKQVYDLGFQSTYCKICTSQLCAYHAEEICEKCIPSNITIPHSLTPVSISQAERSVMFCPEPKYMAIMSNGKSAMSPKDIKKQAGIFGKTLESTEVMEIFFLEKDDPYIALRKLLTVKGNDPNIFITVGYSRKMYDNPEPNRNIGLKLSTIVFPTGKLQIKFKTFKNWKQQMDFYQEFGLKESINDMYIPTSFMVKIKDNESSINNLFTVCKKLQSNSEIQMCEPILFSL